MCGIAGVIGKNVKSQIEFFKQHVHEKSTKYEKGTNHTWWTCFSDFLPKPTKVRCIKVKKICEHFRPDLNNKKYPCVWERTKYISWSDRVCSIKTCPLKGAI
jgi:hypothetical protein